MKLQLSKKEVESIILEWANARYGQDSFDKVKLGNEYTYGDDHTILSKKQAVEE